MRILAPFASAAQAALLATSVGEPSEHWAYRAPVRSELPAVRDEAWVRNPIDSFVIARLESEGLRPAPEAVRHTLIRRLALDLTGLPPEPAEIDAFLADESTGAYGRLVQRLLASPHYGEHMARTWLDLARYADTNGYEKDERRTMWRWRDWVIDAFNGDVPFDRFTIEQLAGDLLPDATLEQRVATGFHRNTMVNAEGGVDAEEFRVDAIVDRVNTTASVWLGTTLACAQCHDHKYDPFSQREYFRLYAYFDQTADSGSSVDPRLRAPTQQQAKKLARLQSEMAVLEAELAGDDAAMDAEQAAWEATARAGLPPPIEWRVLEPLSAVSRAGATLERLPDGSLIADGAAVQPEVYTVRARVPAGVYTALRLEALAHPSLPAQGPGRADNGNFVLSGLEAELAGRPLVFAGARADYEQPEFRIPGVLDADPNTGWAVAGRHTDTDAVLLLAEPLAVEGEGNLVVTLRHESNHVAHVLGRFRLALTDATSMRARILPAELGPWRAVGPFAAESGAEAHERAFEPEREFLQGPRLSAAYGDRAWSEHPEWTDGVVHALPEAPEIGATYLTRTLNAPDARAATLFLGSDDSIKVWLNGELVHANAAVRNAARDQDRVTLRLVAGENRLLVKVTNHAGDHAFVFELARAATGGVPAAVEALLRKDALSRSAEEESTVRGWLEASAPLDALTPLADRALRRARTERDAAEAAALRAWFREHASEPGRERHAELARLRGEHTALDEAIPGALVLATVAEPRTTYLHVRGSFLDRGVELEPGGPAVLPPIAGSDRLALARWLVDPAHPLTARVAVNRIWEQLFGRGLVATSDDLGTRGEPPSHPELLDWLATEYVRLGWSTKALIALIVDSATYRQSSRVTRELGERDPENRLLARASRLRLPAEGVRDAALAAAGLLERTVGGPSVYPYQPQGIWNVTYNADRWRDDRGPDRYRRGLYTFWRRTAPYPTFMLFDAPSRELACTRRERSNTPLQALALLNDPAFVEAAGGLARRILREAPAGERAALGFELCTARRPDADELDVLLGLYRQQRAAFAADPAAAQALVHSAAPVNAGGEELVDGEAAIELAAWTIVASALLNLDETVTRE